MSALLKYAHTSWDQIFGNNRTKPQSLFALLGASILSYKILSYACSIFKTFLIPSKDLIARYGKNTWAVITGATHGLGRSFAFELASKGFNIVLLARNQDKLNQVKSEIEKAYPTVKVIDILADFQRSNESEFWEPIAKTLNELDISILVNNVGVAGGKALTDYTDRELLVNFNVNCLAMVNLTRIVLPKLVERPSRGAIINVGSVTGYIPLPYYVPYSPSKAFVWFFSESLRKTYSDKLDIMALNPARFISNMALVNKKTEFWDLNPEDVAKAALSRLGIENETLGHWRHKLYKHVHFLIPRSILIKSLVKKGPSRLKEMQKMLAERAEESENLNNS